MVAKDGAVVAQWEGGAEEGLEGEGGRVMAEDGASVAQQEGDTVEGLEGEGGKVVAKDSAAAIEVQDDVVVVGCGAWQHSFGGGRHPSWRNWQWIISELKKC